MSNIDDTRIAPIHRDIQPLSLNPAAVYLTRFASAHSRTTMQTALTNIAEIIQPGASCFAVRWSDLRYPHTTAIRTRLMELYQPATTNKILSALRGVLKEAWRLGLMSAEDYHRATDLENVKSKTLPAGRDLDSGEIVALSRACAADDSPAGIRDDAILGVLYTCGLRRAELVKLDLTDFDTNTGKLSIRSGKGRKDRTSYLNNGTLAAVQGWLAIRGRESGALFNPILKNGAITPRPMTEQAVYKLLIKRAGQAGVADFSPHDFRRTFVGDLLDAGVDIATVAELAGHADVNTTRRYDRRPEETKRAAIAKLHYPRQRKEH